MQNAGGEQGEEARKMMEDQVPLSSLFLVFTVL